MASKTKLKLKKKEFRVESKIINLERFAYDVFAYSTSKFGIPADCICKWKDRENDYGLPNFIIVLSRFIFRCQVKERSNWYTEFKPYYESTKFKSFDSIVPALQRVMYETASFGRGLIHYEVIVTLALICELILFLYAEDCLLYIQELVHYWFECWFSRKKELEKSGGLADLYQKFNNPEEAKVDIFFSEFIPAYCIPYDGSRSLQDVFDQEFNKFFHLSAKNIADMEKAVREEAERKDEIIRQLAAQISTACLASRHRVETSKSNKPRNSGLGIQTHEELLRNVLGADTETSPDNIQRKSDQILQRVRRGTPGKKERQRKLSSPQSTTAGVEFLKTRVGGVEAAISNVDEDSENETPSNTGLGIQSHDDLLQNIFGTDATSPKDSEGSPKTFQRKGGQKLARDRRGTADKKERQKKLSSPQSTIVGESLKTHVVGAEAAISNVDDDPENETPSNTGLGIQSHEELLRNIFGTYVTLPKDSEESPENVQSKSERKLARGRRGTTGKKDTQKKLSSPLSAGTDVEPLGTVVVGAEAAIPAVEEPGSKMPRNTGLGIQTHEDLLQSVLGYDSKASPENVQSKSERKLTRNRRGPTGKKDTQKKLSSPLSAVTDVEPLGTVVMRAEAAIPAVEEPGSKMPRNTGLGIQTHEDLLRDVLGTDPEASPENVQSKSGRKLARDRRGIAGKIQRQQMLSSPHSAVTDVEPLGTVVMGAEAAIPAVEYSGSEMPRNTGLGIQTHEDLLRDVLGANPEASPENVQSGQYHRDHRGTAGKKERQKKPYIVHSKREDFERLKTGVVGAEASTPTDDIDSERGIPRNADHAIEIQDYLLRKLLGTYTTSRQDLFSRSCERTAEHRRESSSQGKAILTLEKFEQLHTNVLGAEAEHLGLPLSPKANKDLECLSMQKEIEESATTSSPFSDNLEPYYQYLGLPLPAKTTEDFSKSSKEGQIKKPSSHSASVDFEYSGLPLAAKFGEDLSEIYKNSGLGIQKHENLYRDAFGANVSSPKDISSAISQKVDAIRRESHAENIRMKKVTGPCIPIEVSERLKTRPSKIAFSTSQPPISGESSQRTERHRTGSYCQKDRQKKTSSCHSSMESLQRLKTNTLESSYAVSTHHLSTPGHLGTESSQTGSSSQENVQKIKSSLSSTKDHKRSRTSPLEVGSTTSLQHIYSGSSQRTERNRTGSSSQKDILKKSSSRISSLKGFESLETGLFRSDFAASPLSLSSACLEITERDQTRSSTQKYIRKVKSDPISTKEDPESSRKSQEIESDGTVSSSQKDRQKKTPSFHSPLEALEPLKINLSEAGTSSPQYISSTERDRTESLSQQDRLKKTSSPHSSFEGLEHLKTGSFGSEFATSHQSLSSACFEMTERDQTRSSTKKYVQKVKSIAISTQRGPESSRKSSLGIEVAESLLHPLNIEGSSRQKDKQKETSTESLEGPEPLKTVSLGTFSATSPQSLSSACLEITERDQTRSFSPILTTEGPERSRTSPLGAAAATSKGNIQDSSIQTLKDTDLWSMTPQQMIQLLFGDKPATLDAK